MTTWTEAAVAAALGIAPPSGNESATFSAVSTDTRNLPDGALFVALVGETHDGHAFLAQAAQAGARGAVVEYVPDGAPAAMRYFVVPDTLDALGKLGRFQRRRLGVRVCAITGSNGKTTTKELLRAVLQTRQRVYATPGNLNNLIGVPLTFLGVPADTEVVIAELGTSIPGEIARLAAIAEPDAAVITTISAEHLEGLGDLEGVLREETSVLPWLPDSAVVVIPEEPPALVARTRALARSVRVVGFGEDIEPALRAEDVTLDDEGCPNFRWAGKTVSLRVPGLHNARNALLALALGDAWGVDADAAVRALATVKPAAMRSEIRRIGDLVILADCYNANPGSVLAAAELVARMPRRGGRVAILGSMLELGPTSDSIHADIARQVAGHDLDVIVATGAFTRAFAPLAPELGERLIAVYDPLAAFDALKPRMHGNEVVLLKGSRGVALERLLPRFEENWGVLHPHGETSGSRASSTGSGDRAIGSPKEHTPTSSNRNKTHNGGGD